MNIDWLNGGEQLTNLTPVPCLVADHQTLEFTPPLGFLEYPKSCGRDWKDFRTGPCDHTYNGRFTDKEAAAFLQAWLFFGTLCMLTGLPVKVRDWVKRNGDGDLEVTFTRLNDILPLWQARYQAWPVDRLDHEGAGTDRLIELTTQLYLNALSDGPSHDKGKCPLSPVVSLSIIVLRKILISAKCLIFPKAQLDPLEILSDYPQKWIRDALAANGWCHHEFDRLSRVYSSLGLCYLAMLGPRRVDKDHKYCDTKHPPTGGSTPRHVRHGCSCSQIGPEPEQLLAIIEKGLIPLVRLKEDTTMGEKTVELVHKRPDEALRYVAVSHVCSEGLGNSYANTLPLCQLEKIQHAVDKLHAGFGRGAGAEALEPYQMLFWIDTLCVPLELFNSSARDQAIASMAQIYTDAEKVLVFDAEVMSISPGDHLPPFAKELLTGACAWWSRLWTLQEAYLAKSLFFLTGAGLMSVDIYRQANDFFLGYRKEAWKVKLTASIIREQVILKEVFNAFTTLWACQSGLEEEKPNHLWTALATRATSKQEDEVLCLATLFGVDVRKIIEHAAPERMPALMDQNVLYPSRMIFWSKFVQGEENDSHSEAAPAWYMRKPFRWAPQPFLLGTHDFGVEREYHRHNEAKEELAQMSPEGLQVRYPGMTVTMKRPDKADRVYWAQEPEGANGLLCISLKA